MSGLPAVSTLQRKLIDNGHIASIVVIAVAYVVTYGEYFSNLRSSSGPLFSLTHLAIATVLGLIYLLLTIAGPNRFTPLAGNHALTAYFITLVILMLTIAFLLAGGNGIWLIFMPIIATATTDLPAGRRWLIYVAVLFGMAAPYYLRFDNWQTSLWATLTFSPAIIFVIIFVRATQSAEQAQAKAESLAAELAEANQKLADYAIQAEEMATVQERNRLAREIHDNLGHYLTVVNVQINAARALLEKDPARADDALVKAARLSQEGLQAVRQSVSSLRESPLGRQSLIDAIASLAVETQATGIIAELHVKGEARHLDPRTELTLYRAAQEGLTNVRKHARASRVDLTIDFEDPENVVLELCDNGLGREPQTVNSGFGLLGIEERARQLSGTVSIKTGRGAGYCLVIDLPTPSMNSNIKLSEEDIEHGH